MSDDDMEEYEPQIGDEVAIPIGEEGEYEYSSIEDTGELDPADGMWQVTVKGHGVKKVYWSDEEQTWMVHNAAD